MALVLADRVKDTTTTTGTGAVTLSNSAPVGYRTFGAAVGDGNTTYYTIAGQGTSEWEVGLGTYTATGTSLSRDVVLASSNANALVSFSAGTKDVFVTYPAGKAIADGYGTLPVANGGTGVTTSTGTGSVVLSTSPSLTTPTFSKPVLNDGYTEEVFAITDGATVNLDPNNGSIQTWTLGASRTPGQANWAAGQSITLMVDDGTAYSITWTTLGVVWETNAGAAPTLATSGYTVITLWKVGTTIYGARVGDV